MRMPVTERFTVKGDEVLEKVKQLIHEGNIRKVRLIHDSNTIFEIPLTVGAPVTVAVILAAPLLAAIGAFAALVTECTIEVEKADES
jgi:hypothetical protein